MAIIPHLVKMIICCTSTLFCILAMALPYWTWKTSISSVTYSGLWKECGLLGPCEYSRERGAIYNLERAMVTMGVFLLLGAVVCAAIQLKQAWKQRDGSTSVSFVASGLSAIAGLCLLIAFSATADRVRISMDRKSVTRSLSFGASFGLAIVSWLLSWVQSGLFIVLSRSQSTGSGGP